MTNYTNAPNAPAAISATYPAQPTEFERSVFLRDRVKDGLKALSGSDEMGQGAALLCEYLEGIGARDLVEAYKAIKKA